MKNRKHPRTRKVVVGTALALVSLTAPLAFTADASAQTTALFVKGRGVLTIYGDDKADGINVSRDRAGAIEVDGGAVDIRGALATVANVDSIVVLGGAGADRIAIDDTNGPLPAARLVGGGGNDVLFGGSADDQLFGGDGNDVLTGGAGADRSFGGTGNDTTVWNPGDGSDLNEGGDGSDTVTVNGGGVGEAFTAAADGSRVRFDRVSPLPFSLDIGTSERLVVNGNGGDDTFAATGDLASLLSLAVDGGPGNDRIAGGNGNDTLIGGAGDDAVDGNQGADTAVLGDGDDTFQWDAGDGSDTVEGQAGQDALVFNGAGVAEQLSLSANGTRALLQRDVGHISMDLDGIERVVANPFGGADTVTVNDLSRTDVAVAQINLSAAPGGSTGDGATDSVVVNGTDGADQVKVTGTSSGGVSVKGLDPFVEVTGSDGTADNLTVNALGGDDTVDAGGLADGVIGLTLDGGTGTNVLIP